MADWYYARGTQRHGPVSDAELKRLAHSGGLLSGDLVWTKGMGGWGPAHRVAGLFPTAPHGPQGKQPPPDLDPDAVGASPPVDLSQVVERLATPVRGWLARLKDSEWLKSHAPPPGATAVSLHKLVWPWDKEKYWGVHDEVCAYVKAIETRYGMNSEAYAFAGNETSYWLSLSDDEQTVDELLELHRRVKLAYEGADLLPDPRPVDEFKLALSQRRREHKAAAAEERQRFENMRSAVFMGNLDHSLLQEFRAKWRNMR